MKVKTKREALSKGRGSTDQIYIPKYNTKKMILILLIHLLYENKEAGKQIKVPGVEPNHMSRALADERRRETSARTTTPNDLFIGFLYCKSYKYIQVINKSHRY